MTVYPKQDGFLRELHPETYGTFVRNRVKHTSRAFEAIDDAKRILAELEQAVIDTADGKLPDPGEIASRTHGLRDATDRILVSLIEARLQHQDAQGTPPND